MRIDLQFADNAPATFMFEFTDANGQEIDYTGSTFKLQVKARDSSNAPTGSALLTLETGDGIAGDLSLGEFQPTFPKYVESPLDGLPAGDYVYDLLRLTSGDPVERVAWGLIDVETGVTA